MATVICAYPGADAVGKAHLEYPANISILRVPSPVLFPEDFYFRSFAKGVDGILVTGCGTDCPYEGVYQKLSRRIDGIVRRMTGPAWGAGFTWTRGSSWALSWV